MSDDEIPVRVRVEVASKYFESSQGAVVLVGEDDDDARESAAELLGTLARKVAESIDAMLPMGDVMLLVDALADRLSVSTADFSDFTDEDGDLDLDRVVDFFGGRFDLVRHQLDQANEQSVTNLRDYTDVRKLLNNIELKIKAERAVGGDEGYLTVGEVETILAGKVVPLGRYDAPATGPRAAIERAERKRAQVLTALIRVLASAGYNDHNPDVIMEAATLRSTIESVKQRFGVPELWMLTEGTSAQPVAHDWVGEVSRRLDTMPDGVVAMLDEMLRVTGLPRQDVTPLGRIKDLVAAEMVLARCGASLGVRPALVPEGIVELKAFRENIAHALGLSPSASADVVLAEAAMVKSNLDALRETDKRIGALVVEELGIQEEALKPFDRLHEDVRAALGHARNTDAAEQLRKQRHLMVQILLDQGGLDEVDENRMHWSLTQAFDHVRRTTSASVVELVGFLGLPEGSTAAAVVDKVRDMAAENARLRAEQDDIVSATQRFKIFQGEVHRTNVAYRLSMLFGSGDVAVLPPSAQPVRARLDGGQLNARVRAVRLRDDIEKGVDRLYVRDLANPDMFEVTGKDAACHGIRYPWSSLGEDDDVVDASAEVRYRVMYSPANGKRDDLFEVMDTVTDEAANAFFHQREAFDDARRRNTSARPAMLTP